MPELPEVETMRRGVARVRGARVADVRRPRGGRLRPSLLEPALPALRRRLRGARVTDVGRLGKRVVLAFDTGEHLVFEPRMTGLALVTEPPTAEHVRLRLVLEPAPDLVFWDRRGLGTLRLLDRPALDRVAGALGPDALDLDGPGLAARLAARRAPIKPALLDQAAVAGVGNIYACEALHAAGIAPTRPCAALDARAWDRLARELRRVLEDAIAAGGSTLGDGTYVAADLVPGSYQSRHGVYGREGLPCARCGPAAPVVRTVMAQRATFHCPRCQAR